MENKKKSNGTLIGILIGIIIMLLVGVALYTTGNINFKESTKDTTKESNTYKVEDYVTKEKVNIGDETINVERVVFKNLDSTLTQKYLEEQAKLIATAETTYDYFTSRYKKEELSGYYIEGGQNLAKSNIWYQINKDILTVHYELERVEEIGTETLLAVTNINLKSKKVMTNEELLKLGNSSFNDIATKEYERVLEECTKDVNGKGFCYYDGKNRETYIEVTLEEHKNNKETFISNIESKLDEIIKVYIQDGKIKYDYTLLSIRLVNEAIGTGGPFPHTVVEVGEYK